MPAGKEDAPGLALDPFAAESLSLCVAHAKKILNAGPADVQRLVQFDPAHDRLTLRDGQHFHCALGLGGHVRFEVYFLTWIPHAPFATTNLRTNEIVQQLTDCRIDFGIIRKNATAPGLKSVFLGVVSYVALVPDQMARHKRSSSPRRTLAQTPALPNFVW
jgi:hypothetical protein